MDVLIVTYGCYTCTDAAPIVSNEHKEVGLFTSYEVAILRMPDGYKKSIAVWYAQTGSRVKPSTSTSGLSYRLFPRNPDVADGALHE